VEVSEEEEEEDMVVGGLEEEGREGADLLPWEQRERVVEERGARRGSKGVEEVDRRRGGM